MNDSTNLATASLLTSTETHTAAGKKPVNTLTYHQRRDLKTFVNNLTLWEGETPIERYFLVPLIDKGVSGVAAWYDPKNRLSYDKIQGRIDTGKANGVGLVLGEQPDGTHIIAVDFDDENAYKIAETTFGQIDVAFPPTATCKSGRPNREQRFYRVSSAFRKHILVLDHCEGVPKVKGEQLELRLSNHQSVLPFSAHTEPGLIYSGFQTLDNITMLPDSTIEKLNYLLSLEVEEPKQVKQQTGKQSQIDVTWEDSQGNTLKLRYIQKSLARILAAAKTKAEITTPRMKSLNDAAFTCGGVAHYGLKFERVKKLLLSATRKNGLLKEEGQNRILDVIVDGFEKGRSKPFFLAPDPNADNEVYETAKFQLNEIIEEHYASRLSFNTLTNEIWLDNKPLARTGKVFKELVETYPELDVNHTTLDTFLLEYAMENSFSPIKNYLSSLSKKWDGTPRLNLMAEQCLGTTDSLHLTYIHHWLISAVARVFKPGCQADNVLILQGGQGIGKSRFFRTLAGEGYASISNGVSDKDAVLQLIANWIIEFGEIDYISGKEQTKIKDFITQLIDKLRLPYARTPSSHPRQCVFAGTTNETNFLTDTTGSRRFWVIPVNKRIDIDWLVANRDQIWAEALHYFESGEKWHLNELEEQAQINANRKYQPSDTWEENLLVNAHFCILESDRKMTDEKYVLVSEMLKRIGIGEAFQNLPEQIRMGKVLQRNGFRKGTRINTKNGKIQPWYVPVGFGQPVVNTPEPTPLVESQVKPNDTKPEPAKTNPIKQAREFPDHPEAEAIPDTEEITRLKKEKAFEDLCKAVDYNDGLIYPYRTNPRQPNANPYPKREDPYAPIPYDPTLDQYNPILPTR